MIFYLHSIYNGGNKYFAVDEWSEADNCYYPVPTFEHLDGSLEIATLYQMLEKYGCKKLVLDI